MLNISDTDISFQFDNLKIKVIKINYGVFLHPFPKHRHGNHFYEAHLVCGGKGRLIADGQEYPLSAGTLYMTGPLVTHEQLTDSLDPMDEYCIQFKVSENSRGKSGRSAELIKNTNFWLGADTQNMIGLFEMLTEEDEKRELGYAKSVINLTSQLLISLARNYAGSEKATDYAKITPDDKRMIIVDDAFLYSYAAITLDELCRRLNLSRRPTQRFLKKNYGKTFIELRTEARMNKAEELMAGGATPAEAAAAVGYESARSILKILDERRSSK
ncbi:MAG: helix-turn-helix domain-containing protein [Oscillospiraceae bacterium]|nr:helix-turn-helix domain-containing protein [Oscillospiraceae bacterium]